MTTPAPDLRELLAKATKGPWEYCPCGCGFIGGGDDQVATVTDGEWGDVGIDITTGKREMVHHWGTVPPERAAANGSLIVAAVNALPSHLDTIARLEVRIGEMEVAVRDLAVASTNFYVQQSAENDFRLCDALAACDEIVPGCRALTPETDHDE